MPIFMLKYILHESGLFPFSPVLHIQCLSTRHIRGTARYLLKEWMDS